MTPENDLLAATIAFAAEAHAGQEYGGSSYIRHPLRVMERLGPGAHYFRVVAVLHDVLEDTDRILPRWVPIFVRQAVELLTREEDESYERYIQCIVEAPGWQGEAARAVKTADLLENLSCDPTERQKVKYHAALVALRYDAQHEETQVAQMEGME